jgi:hypothetical protein
MLGSANCNSQICRIKSQTFIQITGFNEPSLQIIPLDKKAKKLMPRTSYLPRSPEDPLH